MVYLLFWMCWIQLSFLVDALSSRTFLHWRKWVRQPMLLWQWDMRRKNHFLHFAQHRPRFQSQADFQCLRTSSRHWKIVWLHSHHQIVLVLLQTGEHLLWGIPLQNQSTLGWHIHEQHKTEFLVPELQWWGTGNYCFFLVASHSQWRWGHSMRELLANCSQLCRGEFQKWLPSISLLRNLKTTPQSENTRMKLHWWCRQQWELEQVPMIVSRIVG